MAKGGHGQEQHITDSGPAWAAQVCPWSLCAMWGLGPELHLNRGWRMVSSALPFLLFNNTDAVAPPVSQWRLTLSEGRMVF